MSEELTAYIELLDQLDNIADETEQMCQERNIDVQQLGASVQHAINLQHTEHAQVVSVLARSLSSAMRLWINPDYVK